MSVEEMVGTSGPMVTPGHPDRQALEQEPQLAGLLPALEGSHQGLLDTQQIALSPERLVEIQQAQDVLDLRHDDVIRAIWFCILAAIFFITDEAVKERLEELRRTLLPDGLSAVKKSYREQVGQARIVESRLTVDDRSLMASIRLGQGTLLDAVEEWFELARQLGELDRERNGSLPVAGAPARNRVSAARNQWIRAIHLIRDVLVLLPSSNPAIAAIVERIAAAEQDATRRVQGRNGEPAADPPDDTGADRDTGSEPAELEQTVDLRAGSATPGEVFRDGAGASDVANDEVSGELTVADAG